MPKRQTETLTRRRVERLVRQWLSDERAYKEIAGKDADGLIAAGIASGLRMSIRDVRRIFHLPNK